MRFLIASCRWLFASALPLYLGGDGGSSSSSQQTSTQQTDARVVGGASSTNVSAQSSTVNVSDAGAIHEAFKFANEMAAGALTGEQKIMDQSIKAIGDAYSTAKAGEQKVLVGAALAIVGVVAVKSLKG